jgi:phosphoribosyl-ATP pyrophosphohydrolase
MSENNIIQELYKIIEERRENPIKGSYTSYLFEEGLDKILKKIGEESSEVIIGSKNNTPKEVISEISDLAYHVLVLMVLQGIKIEDIVTELEKRSEKICNKKQKKENIASIH